MLKLDTIRTVGVIAFLKAAPVLGFVISNFLLASTWSQEDYGYYSLTLGAIFFLSPLLSAGMPELIARKGSVFSFQKKYSHIARLYVQAMTITIFASILLLVPLTMAGYMRNPFYYLILLAPLLSLSLITSSVDRAKGDLVSSQLMNATFRLLASFLIFLLWKTSLASGSNVAVSYSITGLFLACLIFNNVAKNAKFVNVKLYPVRVYISLLRMGWPFVIIALMQGLKNFGDLFIVGFLIDRNAAATYSIALQLVVILAFAQMVMAELFSRKFSWALKRKSTGEINRWLRTYRACSLSFGLLIYITLIFSCGFLIDRILGEEYRQLTVLFAILGAGRLVHLYHGPVMQILALSNLQAEAAKTTVLTGLVGAGLSILCVKTIGLFGAAISGSLSISLWAYLLSKKVKLFLPEIDQA